MYFNGGEGKDTHVEAESELWIDDFMEADERYESSKFVDSDFKSGGGCFSKMRDSVLVSGGIQY
jgi:hypothetical protein